MNWKDRIENRPNALAGKPVIKGTRISVELLLERLGDGFSEQELLGSFPNITREDIQAACAYAAESISTSKVVHLDEAV
jgi:uncharacterized protein (DUF433 family)